MTGDFTIRGATGADIETILGLITELAVYEKLTHLLEVTPARLRQHLFGERPVAECVLVEAVPAAEGGTPQAVGFALFFTNFSTFLGKPGLYLEDLYVLPDFRGQGLGQRLLRHLAALAVARDYGRFEWCVLDWNEPAIRFYERMGAERLLDWRLCRVTGDALAAMADGR